MSHEMSFRQARRLRANDNIDDSSCDFVATRYGSMVFPTPIKCKHTKSTNKKRCKNKRKHNSKK